MNIIKPQTAILLESGKFGGAFSYEQRRRNKLDFGRMETIEKWDEHNIVPQEGLNHFLNVNLNQKTAIGTWYIGLYSNTYTPLDGDVYTDIGTTFTEINADYNETTRPAFVPDGDATVKLITNEASRATFTFNAGATVAGALFVSSNIKGDSAASGAVLQAASAHSPSRSMIANDELLVKYSFLGSSS
jgi:hypothetical protein